MLLSPKERKGLCHRYPESDTWTWDLCKCSDEILKHCKNLSATELFTSGQISKDGTLCKVILYKKEVFSQIQVKSQQSPYSSWRCQSWMRQVFWLHWKETLFIFFKLHETEIASIPDIGAVTAQFWNLHNFLESHPILLRSLAYCDTKTTNFSGPGANGP